MSEFLARAREAANAAFDEHCKAWERLEGIAEPTIADLEEWISVRDAFYAAQEEFENILRQIAGR